MGNFYFKHDEDIRLTHRTMLTTFVMIIKAAPQISILFGASLVSNIIPYRGILHSIWCSQPSVSKLSKYTAVSNIMIKPNNYQLLKIWYNHMSFQTFSKSRKSKDSLTSSCEDFFLYIELSLSVLCKLKFSKTTQNVQSQGNIHCYYYNVLLIL